MPAPNNPSVDPVFAEVAKAIYGDIDPREAIEVFKAQSPAVHVDKDKAEDERRVAATGLAATGVAGVGGLHAIKTTRDEHVNRMAAAGSEKHKAKKAAIDAKQAAKKAKKAAKPAGRIARHIRVKPTTAAAALGAGWAGLHGVELLGDSLATRAQVKALKDANDKVSKALRLKPLNPRAARPHPSLKAKRPKSKPLPSSPTSNPGLYQPLSKAGSRSHINPETKRRLKDAGRSAAGYGVAAAGGGALVGTATGRKAKVLRKVPKKYLVPAGIGALVVGSSYGADKAAQAAFPGQVAKNADRVNDVVWRGEISKVDNDRQQVFGWASVSEIGGEPVVDLQGDYVPIDEIEKSAYNYVIHSRKGGDMHQRVGKGLYGDTEPLHTSDMIESFVATPEKLEKMGLAPDAMPTGWWIGFKVNDPEQWDKVKNGERSGFSIHGSGQRSAHVAKATASDEEKSARRALGAATATSLAGTAGSGLGTATALGHKVPVLRKIPKKYGVPIALASSGAGTVSTTLALGRHNKKTAEAQRKRLKEANVVKRGPGVKERTRQAAHPPAVKLTPVKHSSFIEGMGYQPQTRRLAYKLKTRDEPYHYRVKPDRAAAAMRSNSKGSHFAREVKGKARRPKRYTPADRARLFASPQVSKAAKFANTSSSSADKVLGSSSGSMPIASKPSNGPKSSSSLAAHSRKRTLSPAKKTKARSPASPSQTKTPTVPGGNIGVL